MLFFNALALLIFMAATTTIALPATVPVPSPAPAPAPHPRRDPQCMTPTQGTAIAAAYAQLIASYTPSLAESVLTPNFTDYSESVNSLINSCPQGSAALFLPLLAPTFASRSMFEAGQGQQAAIDFRQLNVWTACDTVVMRWMTTNTANVSDAKPVVGLIALETVPNPQGAATYPFLIDTVYSEFDAAAWLQNLEEAGVCARSQGDGPPGGAEPTSSSPPAQASALPAAMGSPPPPPTTEPARAAVAGVPTSTPQVAVVGPDGIVQEQPVA